MSLSTDTNTLSKKKKIKGEIWVRYPKNNLYLISNYGRVINTKTNNILQPTLGKTAVRQELRGNKTGCATQYISSMAVLVYSLFNKDPTPGFISYKDGNPYNISLDNMFIHRKSFNEESTSTVNNTLTLPKTSFTNDITEFNKLSVIVNGKEYYKEDLQNMPISELETLAISKDKEYKENLIKLLLS
jgi:hypothetical protein